MLYSEAIAVLEIPLSSFSRISIFCSIDKLTRFLLGYLGSATTWLALGHASVRVRVATLRDQIFARARARARACCSVDRSVRLSGVRIFEVLYHQIDGWEGVLLVERRPAIMFCSTLSYKQTLNECSQNSNAVSDS